MSLIKMFPQAARRPVASVFHLLATGALLYGAGVAAQTLPDAGRLLREQAKPPVVTPGKPGMVAPAAPSTSDQDTGPKVLVKGFRISGAILIAEAELVAQLHAFVGQSLSLKQLDSVSSLLSGYYAQRGYLARVILPPQDIQDGIVKLQVIEGKRGSLRIDAKGERIDSARVQRFIDNRLASGAPLDMDRLGEALNILNEQPGVIARSSLNRGTSESEIDLTVTTRDKPLVSYTVGANNHSSRGTGEEQATASLTLANPTGYLDALALNATSTRGSTYGSADYSLAIGESGLRLGLNASHLRYQLTQASFAALNAHGTATTGGLSVSYPLARQADFNLSLTGNYDHKRLIDQTIAGETGNRRVQVVSVGLNGQLTPAPDSVLANSTISFGSTLTLGDSDQRNAGALAADAVSRDVQGHFSKLGYNAGYLTALSPTYTLNAAVRGQFADKNLDSSERFTLGGPSGVRAYPVGEATGDEGWLISVTATHKYNDTLAASLFVDAGGVTVNRTLWAGWDAGNPDERNHYTLTGIGVGLDWRIGNALLSASVASPLGKNPGRDTNDKNSDGSPQHRTRAWLSLAAQF